MKKILILALSVIFLLCACGKEQAGSSEPVTEAETVAMQQQEDVETVGLEFTQKDGSYAVTGYHGSDVHVVVPDTHNDIPVTMIAEEAFFESEIQSIVVGSNVEVIEEKAFARSTLLREVVLPASLKVLGIDSTGSWEQGVFYNCTSLEKVTFADNSQLEMIGLAVFRDCPSLKEISIPETVTYIGNWAFSDCLALEELRIPASVTYVGSQAFNEFTFEQKIIIMGDTSSWMTATVDKDFYDWNAHCEARIVYGSDDNGDLSEQAQTNPGGKYNVYLLTKATRFDMNGNAVQVTEYTYDQNGTRTGVESWYDGYEYVFELDENGNIILEEQYYSSNGIKSSYSEYAYDDENNMISHRYVSCSNGEDSDETITSYIYSKDGMILSFEEYISFAQYEEESECRYQYENGRIITRELVSMSTSEVWASWRYGYDEQGNVIEKRLDSHIGDGDKLQRCYRFGYDEWGNLVSIDLESVIADTTYTEHTEYEYTLYENLKADNMPGSAKHFFKENVWHDG